VTRGDVVAPTASRPPVGSLAASHTPSGIYGTIICASVMAAASEVDRTAEVAITVVVTVLVYWIAERWSHILAAGIRGRRVSRREALHMLAEGWPMVQASYLPLVALLLAWMLGADTAAAVDIALAATALLLTGLGWIAAHRGGRTGWAVVGSALLTGALGVVLIGLKALLHH
jgi:positive regulator of sigma E activity